MNIELTTVPSRADLAAISEGIQQYNEGYMPVSVCREPDIKFAVFAKEEGKVIGGIRANAFWNYCILELLWLAPETRGKGVGKALMAEAEAFAREQGFEYVRTETLDFQAKPFYEKLGYKVYGQLDDYPKGHTTYCLVKSLHS